MGNLSSSSTNVFLSVHNSHTKILAGSTISGEIRCPNNSITNDIYSGVTLYFIGKEDTDVLYDSGSHGHKHYSSKKRDIVRTIIPLDTSHAAFKAGRFPFSFHILDQLPSSMFYKDGNGGFCQIRYRCKLQIRGRAAQEVPIEIMAKPPLYSTPSLVDPTIERIQMLHCIPRGGITWSIAVDNTRVGVGETLSISLGIKNESLVKLEHVNAKIIQIVEWHTSGHSSTNKSFIRSATFSKTDSMRPKSKAQLRLIKSRKVFSSTSQSRRLTGQEEVTKAVQEGHNQLTFTIPQHACQSYTGRLIKIRHYVSIEAKASSCYTSPKIEIPIEIVSPRDTPIVVVQAIPMAPSATLPPFFSSGSVPYCEKVQSSGASPYIANTFIVSSDAAATKNNEEGKDTALDDEHFVNYEAAEILPTPNPLD